MANFPTDPPERPNSGRAGPQDSDGSAVLGPAESRLGTSATQREPYKASSRSESTSPAKAAVPGVPVTYNVGERGPAAAAPHATELPPLVRPPVEDGGAQRQRASRRRHCPAQRGNRWRGNSRWRWGEGRHAAGPGSSLRRRGRHRPLPSPNRLRAPWSRSLILCHAASYSDVWHCSHTSSTSLIHMPVADGQPLPPSDWSKPSNSDLV